MGGVNNYNINFMCTFNNCRQNSTINDDFLYFASPPKSTYITASVLSWNDCYHWV